ncbi:hypothetical protein [Methylobacterium fujisawaense]|uniref:hypothetical protein n=1 Tax=Methylobacterium fujisawaense TaxID=107400 RepID=UPI00313C0E24
MDAAPLPFIACAFVLLIAIAGLDAHHGRRSAERAIQDVLLIGALHFALAACVLIAAICMGHAA